MKHIQAFWFEFVTKEQQICSLSNVIAYLLAHPPQSLRTSFLHI